MAVLHHGDVIEKTGGRRPHQIDLEALGLAWLAEAQQWGGAHVVPVLETSPGRLVEAKIEQTRVSAEAARAFGRALALTHAAGATHLGAAPDGWEGDGWMGNAYLIYPRPDETNRSWGRFFGRDRILPNLGPARDNGSIDAAGARVIERLCARLDQGDFDHDEPVLVEAPAARIHGDLWCGNVLWSPRESLGWASPAAGRGKPAMELPDVVGVLIDPAAQGGHAETDLASLEIFGQPYLEEIYAGYNEVSPLAEGWRERRRLHQVHMLIVHANLFGGSYGAETVAAARHYA
ncbi:MAG: fructosamine kinase family protein [Actinomycetaceae bacterium]|nr:fructosamine kinase family protein [Actinomycetaceae bacterium]